MSLKKSLKVMPGIPYLRANDGFESFLGSAITHIKNQKCPVEMMEPYITSSFGGKWRDGDKSKLHAITDRLNNIIDKFLTTDATHLWIVDADIEVPPHGLCELLKLDVDLSSGIYCVHSNWNRAMFGRIPNTERYNYVPRAMGFLRGKVFGDEFMVGGGNGCMLIKRRVFRRYHPKIPPLRFVSPEGRGSDIYFWYRAQKAGFTARIAGTVICGHRPEWRLKDIGDYQVQS